MVGMNERDLKRHIGERLKLTREALGLSQGEVCEALGIGQTRWSNWENGERFPAPDVMVNFCSEFGVTMDWIYRGDRAGLRFDLASKLRKMAS